jgi:hypothetical protein
MHLVSDVMFHYYLQYGAKPEESKATNINRVSPFVDTSKTAATTTMYAVATEHQATQAGVAPPCTNPGLPSGNVGLPSQVGMGFPGLGSGTFNLPGVSQVGMLQMVPVNQGLLSAQQQQQILAMASMLQAQGTVLPQPTMPALSTSRGAAPFLFQPMMNMPGMPNLMMPSMPSHGRGQPNNLIPGNPFNPGAKPPSGK